MVIFLTSLSTISPEIFEAAEVDGHRLEEEVHYLSPDEAVYQDQHDLNYNQFHQSLDNVYVLTGGP